MTLIGVGGFFGVDEPVLVTGVLEDVPEDVPVLFVVTLVGLAAGRMVVAFDVGPVAPALLEQAASRLASKAIQMIAGSFLGSFTMFFIHTLPR